MNKEMKIIAERIAFITPVCSSSAVGSPIVATLLFSSNYFANCVMCLHFNTT